MGKDAFVSTYGESYFLGSPRKVKGTVQTSHFAEAEMERILLEGIQCELDVVHILGWKIGKLKHRECERQQSFCYHRDWTNAEQFNVRRYGRPLDIKGLSQYITSHITELEKQAQDQPQVVLNKLKAHSPSGIGTVYIVALLFFISRGTCPIYDRFANMALEAILHHYAPGAKLSCWELPPKDSREFSSLYTEVLLPYTEKLQCAFGDTYRSSRNIDRALWVYGHQFKG